MYDSCPICYSDWTPIEVELQCCRYCGFQESFSIEMDWELIDKRLEIYEEPQKRSEELSVLIGGKEKKLLSISWDEEKILDKERERKEKKALRIKKSEWIFAASLFILLFIGMNYNGKYNTKRDIERKNIWYKENKV
jgi:hypothetical protein